MFGKVWSCFASLIHFWALQYCNVKEFLLHFICLVDDIIILTFFFMFPIH